LCCSSRLTSRTGLSSAEPWRSICHGRFFLLPSAAPKESHDRGGVVSRAAEVRGGVPNARGGTG
jgi:hypothetical protein